MTKRSALGTIVRLALGLMAGSALFEIYLKVAEATPIGRVLPVAEVAPYGPSAATGYAHRAGVSGMWTTENRAYIEINALGLRDLPGRALNKTADTRRFAIAGDSMVESLQVPVEATFPALMEGALGHTAQRVDVLNLGLAGAAPAVIVKRLKEQAPRLGLDGAVVVVAMGELASRRPDNASEYPGYVTGEGGRAVLSHAFRDGQGFRFRTSTAGQTVYWAIDHVRLALALNNRKNAGLLADLPQAPPRPLPNAACQDQTLLAAEAIWTGQPHGFANARVEAFLSDLAVIARQQQMPVALAIRGLDNRCAENAARRTAVSAAARARIESAGLRFVDVDAEVSRRLEGGSPRELLGFGARIGSGHLNEHGHRVFADVFTDAIRRELMQR